MVGCGFGDGEPSETGKTLLLLRRRRCYRCSAALEVSSSGLSVCVHTVVRESKRGWLVRIYAPAILLARTPAVPSPGPFYFFRTFFLNLRRVFLFLFFRFFPIFLLIFLTPFYKCKIEKFFILI